VIVRILAPIGAFVVGVYVYAAIVDWAFRVTSSPAPDPRDAEFVIP
jgi:hypothetical protein